MRKLPDRPRKAPRATPVPAFARDLAEFVRVQRFKHHLGQGELADLAGVGRRFVSELEGAKPTVRLEAVDAVLAVFGKTIGIVDRPREDLEPPDGQ